MREHRTEGETNTAIVLSVSRSVLCSRSFFRYGESENTSFAFRLPCLSAHNDYPPRYSPQIVHGFYPWRRKTGPGLRKKILPGGLHGWGDQFLPFFIAVADNLAAAAPTLAMTLSNLVACVCGVGAAFHWFSVGHGHLGTL